MASKLLAHLRQQWVAAARALSTSEARWDYPPARGISAQPRAESLCLKPRTARLGGWVRARPSIFKEKGYLAAEREPQRRIVEGGLTIEVGPEVETCLVHVAGELDLATASALESELHRLLSSDLTRVVLDLGDLLFIDSTGLQCLLQATRHSRADGDRLRMLGPNAEIDRVLRFSGMREILPIIG
jgi:anti-sigma B factor antagonist